ncbi:hypothetical protein [Haloferula sp.]|uniref:hypothetical protein n=1 Tax=Haloferula sp. TaxID=2497595 RepID=UPI003C73BB12
MRIVTRASIILGFLTTFTAGLPAVESGTRPTNRPISEASFPEFSWDRVPLYMHIRKDDSFSPEEIAFISKFPLIVTV